MDLTSDERRRLELLEWLFDQGRGAHDPNEFYDGQGHPWSIAREDVQETQGRGMVTAYFEGGGGMSAELTAAGRDRVEQVRAQRADPSARKSACRRALLLWLDRHGAIGGHEKSVTWSGLAGDPAAAAHLGNAFTDDEVDEAAAWLRRHGLIDGLTTAETAGPVRSYLTDDGERCVEDYNGDPRAFITARNTPTPAPQFHAQNMQVATGEHARQTMNVGVDARVLENAIRGLFDLTNALVEDIDEYARLRDAATGDVRADAPTGEPVRTFATRAAALARSGGNAALAAVVTLAVNDLLVQVAHLTSHL